MAPTGGAKNEVKLGTAEFGAELEKLNEGLIAVIEATNFSEEHKSEIGHKVAQAILNFLQAHRTQA